MARLIQAKTILNKGKKRDSWFLSDYTINPFSSCAFNCLYCYIRGSKYGQNLADHVSVKENAIALADKQLAIRARKGEFGFVVLASATDPYLPLEKKYEITRGLLQVLLKHKFPVHIITKGELVTRDLDLLNQISQQAILPPDLKGKLPGVLVSFSFSGMDASIAQIFEPGAPAPASRLRTLEQVARSGLMTGANLIPLLPAITDTPKALEESYQCLAAAGAQYVLAASTTLFGFEPTDSKTMIFNAIRQYFPQLEELYKSIYNLDFQPSKLHQLQLGARTDAMAAKYNLRNAILV